MKKALKGTMTIVLTVLAATLILAGCSSGAATDGAAAAGPVRSLEAAFAEQPILLTSVGQSADVQMVKALIDKTGFTYTMDNAATADSIGDAKTLVLAVGGSTKGLGAAGIQAEDELARAEALIKAAREKGLKVIALHIGGEARRGELSDKFVNAALPVADYILIVESGNEDGLFTKIASEGDVPMDSVTSISEVGPVLKKAFK